MPSQNDNKPIERLILHCLGAISHSAFLNSCVPGWVKEILKQGCVDLAIDCRE